MKMNTLAMIGSIILGIVIGSVGTIFISNVEFNQNVRRQVFDECFNYYSNVDKEHGIDATSIQTCKDKAENF